MFSDVDSEVIRSYGVLNTIVQPDDVPFYGIPFPGFFLIDEDGVIVDKLFNRHLANREGIESIIDSFLGRIEPGRDDPSVAVRADDGIAVAAFVRGGGGVLRVGPRRRLVVRVDMPEGIHIYGEPVPTGMVATTIDVSGPDGLHFEEMEAPPTAPFELPGVDQPLQVWGGSIDFVIPLYADTSLTGLVRDEDDPSIELTVTIRYQACDDDQCFIPRAQTVSLEVPLRAGAVPAFAGMTGWGGETVAMDSDHHLRRLVDRKLERGSSDE